MEPTFAASVGAQMTDASFKRQLLVYAQLFFGMALFGTGTHGAFALYQHQHDHDHTHTHADSEETGTHAG